MAEVWAAQKPFIAVFSANFRESQPKRNFSNQNISGFEIGDQMFQRGDWIDDVGSFLEINENKRVSLPVNGSDQAVRLITEWLNHKRVA